MDFSSSCHFFLYSFFFKNPASQKSICSWCIFKSVNAFDYSNLAIRFVERTSNDDYGIMISGIWQMARGGESDDKIRRSEQVRHRGRLVHSEQCQKQLRRNAVWQSWALFFCSLILSCVFQQSTRTCLTATGSYPAFVCLPSTTQLCLHFLALFILLRLLHSTPSTPFLSISKYPFTWKGIISCFLNTKHSSHTWQLRTLTRHVKYCEEGLYSLSYSPY